MERFKHKETGQVGEVVGKVDITTKLKFEDGSEQIITRANLKRWWEKLEDLPDEEVKPQENVKEKVVEAINKHIEKELKSKPAKSKDKVKTSKEKEKIKDKKIKKNSISNIVKVPTNIKITKSDIKKMNGLLCIKETM